MNITSQDVKEFAYRQGMDLCGIASMDRFATSPPGKRPFDILPGAKSAVVVGVRLVEGVINAQFRNFEDHNPQAQGIYGTYGYTIAPNFHLLYTVYAIAQYIERMTGETTVPLPCGPFGNSVPFSIRHSAVAAGLGEFGWRSIVLTPQFGPRNRFAVVLTHAELEPDPMYSGPKLCLGEKCQICAKVCPTHAISFRDEASVKVEMGGHTYEYNKLNWERCQLAAHKMTKRLGADKDWITTDSPTAQDIQNAWDARGIDKGNNLQNNPTWHCGRCLAYCPVGNWKEKYGDKGLSQGYTAGIVPPDPKTKDQTPKETHTYSSFFDPSPHS